MDDHDRNTEQRQERDLDLELSRLKIVEIAATKLLIATWRAIQEGYIIERGPIADAALELRDRLNPNWPSDPDWLPEELRTTDSSIDGQGDH